MKMPDKVSLEKCSSYGDDLPLALTHLLAPLGGITSFVKPGSRVLIKPNMLTDRTPDEAVTTHPELVRAIIREVRIAQGEPVVGDSPCSAVKLDRVWDKTGFRRLCQEEDVPLLNLEKAGSETFSWEGCPFSISKPVLDADLVINVPKVKTHTFTILTAAMKNLYGALPGYQKAGLHKQFPNPSSFGRFIIELNRRLPVGLHIADGVVAMDGNGPSAGKPFSLGLLAASTQAQSLDATLCRILGIRPSAVAYLQGARSEITLCGTPIDEIQPDAFQVPNTFFAALIPRPLVRLLQPYLWFRPAVSLRCTKCGRCIKACPVLALEMGETKPVLDTAKCIGCCCCHEVCPEKAVTMTQSPFLNFIRRGRMP